MVLARYVCIFLIGFGSLGAQNLPVDPVMKARAERAQSQGVAEGDLPPVPRGIVEPPPLPPPETHLKDTRGGGRVAKAKGHAKGARSSKAAKAGKTSKSTKTAKGANAAPGKHPAKGGRKSSKRVKA